MPLTPEGWTLLKTWEGCRLSAYPDPATGSAPWTIGHGHNRRGGTGADDQAAAGGGLATERCGGGRSCSIRG